MNKVLRGLYLLGVITIIGCAAGNQILPKTPGVSSESQVAMKQKGSPTSHIYVLNTSHELDIYQADNKSLLKSFKFTEPAYDITVNSGGDIFISFPTINAVNVYSPMSETLKYAISVKGPTGITTDNRDILYVNSSGNHDIQAFSTGNTFPIYRTPIFGGFAAYGGVAVDSQGVIFTDVSSGIGATVEKCDPVSSTAYISCKLLPRLFGVTFSGIAVQGNNVVVAGAGQVAWFSLNSWNEVSKLEFGGGYSAGYISMGQDGNLYIPVIGGSEGFVRIIDQSGNHTDFNAGSPRAVTEGV